MSKNAKNVKKTDNDIIIKDELKIDNKKMNAKKKEKIEEDIKIIDKADITNPDPKYRRSGFVTFMLTLALLAIMSYSIYSFLKIDFKDIMEVIKTGSYTLIGLCLILIGFKSTNKKANLYLIIASFIVILFSIFSVTYGHEDSTSNNKYVIDFINQPVTEVMSWAENNKIKLNQLYEYSDTIPKNYVIGQDYGITTLIKDIDTLTITISEGPNFDKEVIVPNFIGFTFDEVMKFIKDNNLSNVNIEFIVNDAKRDTVINHIGTGTLKRNDVVTITFSYGPEDLEDINVKDLSKLSLFEATSYLKRYNIPYEIIYEYSNNINKNNVVKQSITNEIVTDKLILTISKGKEITIPDFSKMSMLEITEWAIKNNIRISYDEIYDKEKSTGSFISSSKNQGDGIEEGANLTITISKGSMVMPEVKNLTEFKLWAENNNILYEEVYEYSSTIKSGEIIKTSPTANSKITESDTIIIYISKGNEVTVPSFIGMSKSNIQTKCNSVGLSCTFKYGGYTESTNKDIATAQSKANGMKVPEGTNVTITLSSGVYVKVNVPSFTGQTKNQITSTCQSLGITCHFTYNNTYSNETKDTAIKQDKSGTMNQGSTVNITLSIGPANTYTVVIDGSMLSQGNPEQTKATLKAKLETACPGVTFKFEFRKVNTGIGYLNQDSQVKVGSNSFIQGKTYNVIINSSN